MLVLKRLIALAVAMRRPLLARGAALAAPVSDSRRPGSSGSQQSATPVMDDIIWFHDFLLWLITPITLFVLALLVDRDACKFNARANPVPSRTTHNTLIEVLWTVMPVLILVAIAVPSFRCCSSSSNMPPADVTIKATGKQWFWTYSYPDQASSSSIR